MLTMLVGHEIAFDCPRKSWTYMTVKSITLIEGCLLSDMKGREEYFYFQLLRLRNNYSCVFFSGQQSSLKYKKEATQLHLFLLCIAILLQPRPLLTYTMHKLCISRINASYMKLQGIVEC